MTLRARCRNQVSNILQLACLFAIPVIAISLVLFMAIFAIKCDGSGGFVIGPSGKIICVSSDQFDDTTSTTLSSTHHGPDITSNGLVVMTVTRVVLISVSVLIISFTAWICAWYQRYGNPGTNNVTRTLPADPSSSTAVPLETVVTLRVSEYLAKEDLEKLLGPEHIAAPAV